MGEKTPNVARVLLDLEGKAPTNSRAPLLVGIDGLGGAGKSALAESLADALPVAQVVHFDDFYSPVDPDVRRRFSAQDGYKMLFDWQRLQNQVLRPLHGGTAARYQRYDWPSNRLAEWHDISTSGTVIVEGVYVTRPELRNYFDLTVFVATSRTECLRRMRARGQNSVSAIEQWTQAEDWYIANFKPADFVDLVVSGEHP